MSRKRIYLFVGLLLALLVVGIGWTIEANSGTVAYRTNYIGCETATEAKITHTENLLLAYHRVIDNAGCSQHRITVGGYEHRGHRADFPQLIIGNDRGNGKWYVWLQGPYVDTGKPAVVHEGSRYVSSYGAYLQFGYWWFFVYCGETDQWGFPVSCFELKPTETYGG